MRCFCTFTCCGWAYGCTTTKYTTVEVGTQLGKLGVGWARMTSRYHVLRYKHQPTLHLTSVLDVYEVFECLNMLLTSMWVHPYTDMPVQVRAKIGLIEGYSASHHIHIGCIQCIWAPSYAAAVDAHIGAPLQGYNTVEVGGQILKIGVWVRRSDVAIFLLSLRNISNIMGQNFSIAISTCTKNKYWDKGR